MKKSAVSAGRTFACIILILAFGLSSCKKDENPVKFPNGTIPDTAAIALTGLNTEFDDFNLGCFQIYTNIILVFSSNRTTSGGTFDLVQGAVTIVWDQTNGAFTYASAITNDPFLNSLTGAANTAGDDLGPYRLFSTVDGFEYLLLSSENTEGNLDFYYLRNMPKISEVIPVVHGPFPVTLLNTDYEEAYISFDLNQDTAFFCTDAGGNFDIYLMQRPAGTDLAEWFAGSYSAPVPISTLNTAGEEKCPFVFGDIMVFTSNRTGGMGGYDLYYSLHSNGNWSAPENFGPNVNTEYDEYRPVIGYIPGFTNLLLMFSSDRPGGKGNFDLYFIGVPFPEE